MYVCTVHEDQVPVHDNVPDSLVRSWRSCIMPPSRCPAVDCQDPTRNVGGSIGSLQSG